MLKFDIITIFPDIFDSYLKESIIKRAIEKRLIEFNIHNLRDFAGGVHKTVDDRPFGGGIGMVMKIEPIFKTIQSINKSKPANRKSKTILFTPRGKKFNQKTAYRLSKLDRIIMICGRYEGVDERVAKHIADEEISIGDYVLLGGELAAMVVAETIARLIPGVIGKPQLLKERIPVRKGGGGRGFIEYPQYTRPETFDGGEYVKTLKNLRTKIWRTPKVLLSGNHKEISEWREKHGKLIE